MGNCNTKAFIVHFVTKSEKIRSYENNRSSYTFRLFMDFEQKTLKVIILKNFV